MSEPSEPTSALAAEPNAAQPVAANIAPAKPWYRRFKPWQFSLRTLLVIMAIASAACWYYLLPKVHDEKLAEGYLILQRQYRGKIEVPANPGPGGLSVGMPARLGMNDGYWRIKDLQGRVLVDGNYRKDQEHGWWTTYHPNGRKAVQGKMKNGGRSGLWRTWNAAGQLLSEVTYAWQKPSFATPGQTSHLHGPAKYWHENGKPAAVGAFETNQRSGKWEEWNDQGQLIAEGTYRSGKKHGEWLELATAGEAKLQTIHYVNGLEKEQLENHLRQLAERIEQGDLAQRLTLLSVAADFGEPALPILEKWASHKEEPAVQLAAIRGVARCGGKLQPWQSALEKLTAEDDPHLALAARWELYRHFPDSRREQFAMLMKEAERKGEDSWLDAHQQLREMFVLDPPRRDEIFAIFLRVHSQQHDQISWPLQVVGVEPAHDVAAWRVAVVPFLEKGLNDPNPQQRLVVVGLIRQLLSERSGTIRNPANFAELRWEVPPELAPLIARARQDKDGAVKEKAEHIDEVYYGSGFGSGGGGLF